MSEAQAAPKADPKCGLVAYLSLDGAVRAAEFYQKAFGAEIAAMHPVDDKGRTMHIHLYVNGASLMLGDVYEEHGHAKLKPQGFSLAVMSKDIHKDFQRAVDAGCEVTMPVQTMFWGDLYGALRDPFGVDWVFDQPA